MRAVVEIVVEGHALAVRIAELGDALLFVELEGNPTSSASATGSRLYDEREGEAPGETPAKRALRRIHESLPQ